MGKSLSAPANWCAANEEPRGKLRGIQSEPGYSPHWDVIEISSNRVLGVEALLRWKRDGQTSISPAEFIPLAEESGLIIPIGEWVLHTACVQAQAWHKAGVANLVVAVNISARQFQHPGFIGMVSATIDKTGINPHYLELEITESVAMHDAEKPLPR